MPRIDRIKSIIIELCKTSQLSARHGAILTKGSSRVIFTGTNQDRSRYHNSIVPSTHAEMDVINKMINHLRKQFFCDKQVKRIMGKYTLWVGRITRNNHIANSMPCCDCLKKLKKHGLKRIGFSNDDGDFVICNLTYLTNTHMSKAQKDSLCLTHSHTE
mgnify:FL=1